MVSGGLDRLDLPVPGRGLRGMGGANTMEFEAWLNARQYAQTTIRVYRVYARRFEALYDPLTATTDDLAEFLEYLPKTAPSHRQARKALMLLFTYYKREPNPALKLHQAREPHRLPRPLSEDEHLRWVAACHAMGGRHELAGVLLASTGCRQGELRQARWEDFSLADGYWVIRGKGARQAGPIYRQQPLHPTAVDVLRVAPRPSDWLFPGHRTHMSDTGMRNLLIEIGAFAGLGRITPHRLRHSVATRALVRSGNLRAVQTLMGHKSIASTVQYTQIDHATISALVQDLPV